MPRLSADSLGVIAQMVRSIAIPALEQSLKRYACLVAVALPVMLRSLAGLEHAHAETIVEVGVIDPPFSRCFTLGMVMLSQLLLDRLYPN